MATLIDEFILLILVYVMFGICHSHFSQALKDDIGTIRIQRPHKGPFYVSPKTIDQLISNLGKWARYCIACIKKLSFFNFSVGMLSVL